MAWKGADVGGLWDSHSFSLSNKVGDTTEEGTQIWVLQQQKKPKSHKAAEPQPVQTAAPAPLQREAHPKLVGPQEYTSLAPAPTPPVPRPHSLSCE